MTPKTHPVGTGLMRPTPPDDKWLRDSLMNMAIVSAYTDLAFAPLDGGVSSDIYRVDLPGGVTVCVKRALPKLKVAANWHVPVSRNRWEAEWMRVARAIVPSAAPRILGEDRDAGCFAMEYFPPERFSTWKASLAAGAIDVRDASAIGDMLGRIHAATANRERDCRSLRDGRHFLRHSARALSGRHCVGASASCRSLK